jgi:hypothetical protein
MPIGVIWFRWFGDVGCIERTPLDTIKPGDDLIALANGNFKGIRTCDVVDRDNAVGIAISLRAGRSGHRISVMGPETHPQWVPGISRE